MDAPKPTPSEPPAGGPKLNGEVDLLGRSLTSAETKVLQVYRGLLALLAEDLPPAADANVREAAAAMWNAVTDLALVDERPDL
jgi:hypothetical protein